MNHLKIIEEYEKENGKIFEFEIGIVHNKKIDLTPLKNIYSFEDVFEGMTDIFEEKNDDKDCKIYISKYLGKDYIDELEIPDFVSGFRPKKSLIEKRKVSKSPIVFQPDEKTFNKSSELSIVFQSYNKFTIEPIFDDLSLFRSIKLPDTLEDLSYMFYGSKGDFNLENINTKKVRKMSFMFSYFDSTKTELLRKSLKKLNVSKVEDFRFMFYNMKFNEACFGYNLEGECDLSEWNVKSAVTLEKMFYKCDFKSIGDISLWEIQNVKNFDLMFSNSEIYKIGELHEWNDILKNNEFKEFGTIFDNSKLTDQFTIEKGEILFNKKDKGNNDKENSNENDINYKNEDNDTNEVEINNNEDTSLSEGEEEHMKLLEEIKSNEKQVIKFDIESNVDEVFNKLIQVYKDRKSFSDKEFLLTLYRSLSNTTDELCSQHQYYINNYPFDILYESKVTDEQVDKILDSFGGLKDAKETILNFIKTNKQIYKPKPFIALFIGKPGTGKTMLAQKISEVMGIRYSVLDTSTISSGHEIVGVDRSYKNATRGKLIECIYEARSSNPLIIVDEIDKGLRTRGNYSAGLLSALLKIIDPQQNNRITEAYLDVELDLSNVSYIFTANRIEDIPEEFLSRMQIVLTFNEPTKEEAKNVLENYILPEILQEYESKYKIEFDNDLIDIMLEDQWQHAFANEKCVGYRVFKDIIKDVIRKAYGNKTEDEDKVIVKKEYYVPNKDISEISDIFTI